jgi:hypothetical protein
MNEMQPIPEGNHLGIAKEIVRKLVAFRTDVPFGLSWQAFASAEIVLALNNAASVARAKDGKRKGAGNRCGAFFIAAACDARRRRN